MHCRVTRDQLRVVAYWMRFSLRNVAASIRARTGTKLTVAKIFIDALLADGFCFPHNLEVFLVPASIACKLRVCSKVPEVGRRCGLVRSDMSGTRERW